MPQGAAVEHRSCPTQYNRVRVHACAAHTHLLKHPHAGMALRLTQLQRQAHLHSRGRWGCERWGYFSSRPGDTSVPPGSHSLSMRQLGGCPFLQSDPAVAIHKDWTPLVHTCKCVRMCAVSTHIHTKEMKGGGGSASS